MNYIAYAVTVASIVGTVANSIIFELGKHPEFHIEIEGYEWPATK